MEAKEGRRKEVHERGGVFDYDERDAANENRTDERTQVKDDAAEWDKCGSVKERTKREQREKRREEEKETGAVFQGNQQTQMAESEQYPPTYTDTGIRRAARKDGGRKASTSTLLRFGLIAFARCLRPWAFCRVQQSRVVVVVGCFVC